MSNLLITDEQHDVLISLKEVMHQLRNVNQNVFAWKWAIIALASTLNGALTCLLTGSAGIGALEQNNARKTLSALQQGSELRFPNPYLANPLELLERAVNLSDRIERAGSVLDLSISQKESFEKLFNFRNQFIHFKPQGWVIDMRGMSQIFLSNMEIVEYIVEDNWSFRHMSETHQTELKAFVKSIKQTLNQFVSV